MSLRAIKKDSTDQSVVIRIIDSTAGTPETAVEHDTSGIDLWYRREGATKTSITEAALAALDSAHSDGGIEHIGDGYYRLDLPDAAVATGCNGVMIGGTVTGMIVIGCYIHLVDYDPQNAVRLGLTALPNAAADAAGGLPISDAGGLDLDAKIGALTYTVAGDVDVNVQSWKGAGAPDMTGDAFARLGTPAGASVSADIAAIEAQTDDIGAAGAGLTAIPWNAAWDAEVESEVDDALGGGTGTALTGIPWNAAWDAEVQSEVFDALNAEMTDATSLTANGLLDRLRSVMWILRNKITVTDANGNTVIYKDDSTTAGFTVNAMLTDDSTTTTRLRAA